VIGRTTKGVYFYWLTNLNSQNWSLISVGKKGLQRNRKSLDFFTEIKKSWIRWNKYRTEFPNILFPQIVSCHVWRYTGKSEIVEVQKGFDTTCGGQVLLIFVYKGQRVRSSWTAWPFKFGPIGCPETSATHYPSMLHRLPEGRRSEDIPSFILELLRYKSFFHLGN